MRMSRLARVFGGSAMRHLSITNTRARPEIFQTFAEFPQHGYFVGMSGVVILPSDRPAANSRKKTGPAPTPPPGPGPGPVVPRPSLIRPGLSRGFTRRGYRGPRGWPNRRRALRAARLTTG